MKKDVYIKIKSLQKTENGDNKGEMSVIGTLLYKDSKHIIEYVENNEETGPEETTITVSEDNTVSIVRRGQFSSEMMVEKGKRHHTFYKTPYGELTMGIRSIGVKAKTEHILRWYTLLILTMDLYQKTKWK